MYVRVVACHMSKSYKTNYSVNENETNATQQQQLISCRKIRNSVRV